MIEKLEDQNKYFWGLMVNGENKMIIFLQAAEVAKFDLSEKNIYMLKNLEFCTLILYQHHTYTFGVTNTS